MAPHGCLDQNDIVDDQKGSWPKFSRVQNLWSSKTFLVSNNLAGKFFKLKCIKLEFQYYPWTN